MKILNKSALLVLFMDVQHAAGGLRCLDDNPTGGKEMRLPDGCGSGSGDCPLSMPP